MARNSRSSSVPASKAGSSDDETGANRNDSGCGYEKGSDRQKLKTAKRKVRNKGNICSKKGMEQERKNSVGLDYKCTCGALVRDDECGGIECDICKKWFHPSCEGLTNEAVAAIDRHKLFWLCGECKSYVENFQEIVAGGKDPLLSELTEGLTKMEQKLAKMGENVESVEKALVSQKEVLMEIGSMMKSHVAKTSHAELETVVKKVVREENNTYADMVKKLSNKMEGQGTFEPASQTKELKNAVTDCLEQEKRRRNIVIFNVPEQDADISREEQASRDIRSVQDLIMEGLKLKIHPEKVTRIGKPSIGKSRLVVVTLSDESEKWDLLKMAKQLRNAGERFENIYLAPDLSPAEQVRNRNLRKELKTRRESGEDVIIYKNRVIQRIDKPSGHQGIPGSR